LDYQARRRDDRSAAAACVHGDGHGGGAGSTLQRAGGHPGPSPGTQPRGVTARLQGMA